MKRIYSDDPEQGAFQMNEAENKTATPVEAVGNPAPETKPIEAVTPAVEAAKPEGAQPSPEDNEKAKAVKEAFIRGRIERRENKALKAELEKLKGKLGSKPEAADGTDDDGNASGNDLRREIDELKAQVVALSKASRTNEAEKRRIELEKAADEMLLNDHDIKGVEDMAAVESLIDPVLYARRPDLAVMAAVDDWKRSNGISIQAKQASQQALASAPSSRATAAGQPTAGSRASIMAQISSLDPTKSGAKEELDKLLLKLQSAV